MFHCAKVKTWQLNCPVRRLTRPSSIICYITSLPKYLLHPLQLLRFLLLQFISLQCILLVLAYICLCHLNMIVTPRLQRLAEPVCILRWWSISFCLIEQRWPLSVPCSLKRLLFGQLPRHVLLKCLGLVEEAILDRSYSSLCITMPATIASSGLCFTVQVFLDSGSAGNSNETSLVILYQIPLTSLGKPLSIGEVILSIDGEVLP